jgi:hypothetical protein
VSEEPSQVQPGIHPKLTNPLSEETRKARLYLLGMGAAGIAIVFTGLLPTEIRTLGITFAEADRNSLLLIFALVVAYFLAAFVSYALSDYLEWRSAKRELAMIQLRKHFREQRTEMEHKLTDTQRPVVPPTSEVRRFPLEGQEALDAIDKAERELSEVSGRTIRFAESIIRLRFAFEFLIPPIVGLFSIAALVIKVL